MTAVAAGTPSDGLLLLLRMLLPALCTHASKQSLLASSCLVPKPKNTKLVPPCYVTDCEVLSIFGPPNGWEVLP
jgi:hypothetical protein